MRKIFCHKKALALLLTVLQVTCLLAQDGHIKGRVSNGNEDLSAATVQLGMHTTLTDSKGEFSFSVKAGSYTLVITHVGYGRTEKQVKLEAGKTQHVHFILEANDIMGEVVVLGSRSLVQRSNLNTAVPVDVFTAKQLEQTGQASLTQMLNFSAPSFNASRAVNNEPVTLRGLNPDQLLILVNGTRRHSMAYIPASGARGILGGGSVSNDVNSIPFTAVEKIEILRDGAAAQYGSDAIAGVLNIQLKKSTGKTSVQMQTGQYYKGDGENITIGINRGFSLNNKGFLNFSADFRFNNFTSRGGAHTGTVYTNNKTMDDSLVLARGFDRNKVSNAGSSKITRGGALLNGGYQIGKKTELFWTAMGNSRRTISPQGYTLPKNPNRINPDLFPNGFQSRINHLVTDISGIAGAKGETTNGWRWQLTSAYGNNNDRYYGENVNNPSQYYTLGKTAPTSFYVGTIVYGQLTNNLQFSKSFSSNPGKVSNLSMGAEWRIENYQIRAGEEAAWKNYDSLGRKEGGVGFGSSPYHAVNKSRNVAAGYVDFETEVARRLLVDIAGRYEHYSDFGGNVAGKIAARYKLSERFSVRGSLNNGFRAPSLQQRYYSTINNGLTVRGTVITTGTSGLFRNDSPVATAFGIPSLGAEKSVNVSGGITATLTNSIRMTVDAYWIQIRNRIVASGRFDTANPEVKEILRPFPNITAAHFYVNSINTKTKGVDIVLNGNWKIRTGALLAMLAANFTQTRLFGDIKAAGNLKDDSVNTVTLFSREERGKLEHGQPDSKIVFSLNYKTNKFGILVRNTRFGATGIRFADPALNPDENFSPKILTDLSLSCTPKWWLTFTAGANNIFDVYPDRIQDNRNSREGTFIYSLEASPFGFYGGYYFLTFQFQLPGN